MADVFDKKKRSDIMSRIKAKDTGSEKLVFSHLREKRIYFQRHYRKAPGKPDIAIPSKKLAVFVNGDFWHGYRFRSWKDRIPKKYWQDKIMSNMLRDRKNYRRLRRNGWRVMKIWSHQLNRQPEKTLSKISSFLSKSS